MLNKQTSYTAYNNAELIRMVDNDNGASPMERELSQRLDEVSMEVQMLEATMRERSAKVIGRTRQLFEAEQYK